MTLQVVDASVAIKWFLAEEDGTDAALKILNQIKQDPERFCVPELFFNEMLHVLCKLTLKTALIQEYILALQELGLTRLGNGQKVLSLAADLAVRHGISGYDAIYAANAKLVRGLWITADKRAHKKIVKLNISRLLES